MADIKMINKKTSSLSISSDQQQDPPNQNQPPQQHHNNNDEEDLQQFTHWDDNDVPTDDTNNPVGRGGWSVEEMFRTNQNLGVQSTFKDDLTQYTTVPVEGSKEDRARAAKIAKEIEANEKSKRMAYLENDDEERDLDKETIIPDEAYDSGSQSSYHQQKRHSRGSRGNGNKFPQRKDIVVPENHRANALRDPPPPPRNRQLEHGRQRDRGNHHGNNKSTYQPGPSSLSSNDSNSPRQPPLPPQQQQQQIDTNQKSQNFSRRKEDLKTWSNNFNTAYRQNSQTSDTTSPQKTPPVQQQQQQENPPLPSSQPQQHPLQPQHPAAAVNPTFQPSQPTATIYPPRPTNAWQKGPPDFSSHIIQQQPPQPQHHQPPPPQTFSTQQQLSQALPNTIPSTTTQTQSSLPQEQPPHAEPQSQSHQEANTATETAQSEPPTTEEQQNDEKQQSTESGSTTKFQFNPDAPAFVPQSVRIQTPLSAPPPPQSVPIVSMAAQQHYITAQPFQQGYAIPQSLTNTLPPGYILTTQNVGMQQQQHNPNNILHQQQTFIPYVPAGVPIYNNQPQQQQQQIITSSVGAGGGFPTFVPQHLQQPQLQQQAAQQTFVVRSNYDLANMGTNAVGGGGGYIQSNPQQQHQQIQYATMPIQYQVPLQQQQQQPQPLQFQQPQQFQQQQIYQPIQQPQQQYQQQQPQLPYSQPPPQNGLRRYGQN